MEAFFKYFNCRSTKLLLRKPFFFINSYFLRIPSVAACFLKTLYCNCGRRNLGDVKIEFAKLRAFRAYVPSCLVPQITEFAKLRAFRAYVLTCLTYLCALCAYVTSCLKLLRVYVSTCRKLLRAYVPTCLSTLISHVPTCLHAYIYFSCLRAFEP